MEGEAVVGRSHPRIGGLACRLAHADAHRPEDDGDCPKKYRRY